MTGTQSLCEFLEDVLEDQARRWREVIAETGDERVKALAEDAIRELEILQDASLIGHLHDALLLTSRTWDDLAREFVEFGDAWDRRTKE